MRSYISYLTLLVLCFTSFSLSAQNIKEAVDALPILTTIEKKVANLKIEVPYNSLRFGPYGWVHTGRWEFGLHLMPWFSGEKNAFSVLTENEAISRGAISLREEGQSLPQLYVKDYKVVDVGKRPGIAYAHLDLARQFGNGLKVGIGLAAYKNVQPRRINITEITPKITEEEYVAVFGSKDRQFFLTGHLDYTFRRYKRLRPAVGLAVIRPMRYQNVSTYTIYSGEDGRQVYQTSNKGLFDPSANPLYFMGKVGLQYQLRRHFSIGLEAAVPFSSNTYLGVPLIGIGGRYSFARQW